MYTIVPILGRPAVAGANLTICILYCSPLSVTTTESALPSPGHSGPHTQGPRDIRSGYRVFRQGVWLFIADISLKGGEGKWKQKWKSIEIFCFLIVAVHLEKSAARIPVSVGSAAFISVCLCSVLYVVVSSCGVGRAGVRVRSVSSVVEWWCGCLSVWVVVAGVIYVEVCEVCVSIFEVVCVCVIFWPVMVCMWRGVTLFGLCPCCAVVLLWFFVSLLCDFLCDFLCPCCVIFYFFVNFLLLIFF